MRSARNSIGVQYKVPAAQRSAAMVNTFAKLYKPSHGGYPDTLPSIAPPKPLSEVQ